MAERDRLATTEGVVEPGLSALLSAAEGSQASPSRRLRRVLVRPFPIIVGLALLLLVFMAVFGAAVAPYDPTAIDPVNEYLSPSTTHLMGTDDLGRDVLSRVIIGTRYSMIAVAIVLVSAVLLGTILGAIAGYAGGLWDELVMRITDVFLAFPGIVLALALAAALGPSLINGMIALAVIWWPTYARLVRGQVLSVKENAYVEAARSVGVSVSGILSRHILRNCMAPVLVQISLDVGNVLVAAAGLSFIGLGAQLPTPEWGLMVSTDAPNILTAWWQSTFPGLAIFLSALLFNMAGDITQDLLGVGRNFR